MGCHFLLQCKKVKSESEVAQSCLTLSDPMDCSSLQGSSVHGIFQARVLEWGTIAFSAKGSNSYLFQVIFLMGKSGLETALNFLERVLPPDLFYPLPPILPKRQAWGWIREITSRHNLFKVNPGSCGNRRNNFPWQAVLLSALASLANWNSKGQK